MRAYTAQDQASESAMQTTSCDPAASLTEAAIAQLRDRKRLEACVLLTRAVRINPEYFQGWLWLAAAVETVPQRRLCLEHAVALNPASEVAVRALAQLPPVPESEGEACAPLEPVSAPAQTVKRQPPMPRLGPAVALRATGHVVEPVKREWTVADLVSLFGRLRRQLASGGAALASPARMEPLSLAADQG